MATAQIVLHQSPNKKGELPLALRITHDGRCFYIFTKDYVSHFHWNAQKGEVTRKHPNSIRLNNKLNKILFEARATILELESRGNCTLENIKKQIKSPVQNERSFFHFAEEYFNTMLDSGNHNRHSAERSAVNHFKRFMNNKDIEFIDITYSLLEKFQAYLKGTVKVKDRTTANYLIILRTIYSRAIKSGIVDKINYPFGDNGLRLNRPVSQKIGLSIDQIKRLETVEFDNEVMDHARNRFLFSFYMAGMRVSDLHLLKWSDFKNDRLYYVMRKNNKPGSIKVPDKALAILEKYKNSKQGKNDFVFPEFKNFVNLSDKISLQKQLHYRTAKLNEYLKKISDQLGFEQKLTMHVARHSFASISGDKIPIQRLQQLYRHSSILTTIGYQYSFMFKGSDEALDAVLDY